MKVNYIRSFINALSGFKKDYSVVHTLKADDPRKVIQLKASLNFGFPTNLVFGFKSGHDFDLTDKDIEFLKDVIPDGLFSDYIHCKGVFYFINYDIKKAVVADKAKIEFDKIKVFDWSRASLENLGKNVRVAYDIIENALDEYDESCVYNPDNYTIVKEVPFDISPTFDTSYSLTKDQTKAMHEWQISHFYKYHKSYAKMQKSVSPISIFSVKFESCSIGNWANCICSKCMEAAEAETDEKKREKLKKRGTYEIFNNF